MLSKCCGRSASAPTELAGNPPSPAPGLGTADRGGSRAPAPPGQGRSPGSEGESSGRPAGARAPHLKVVRVREAQGPESFEVGGTWVAAGLGVSRPCDLGWLSPSLCVSLVLQSVKWVQVGSRRQVAGSARGAFGQSSATFLELPGPLGPAEATRPVSGPARGWAHGEAAPRGRPDRREVTVETFVLPPSRGCRELDPGL